MCGLHLLQKHGVEYNVMATVGKETADRANDVYLFFKEQGVKFIQFNPVVERKAGLHEQQQGLKYGGLVTVDNIEAAEVTEWSVGPEDFGDFLIKVFDEWIRHDVGSVFVMNFEWALNAWFGKPSPVCQHAQKCGASLIIEHNGDVYDCDHCVYPEYRLGNIVDDNPLAMVERSTGSGFGDKDMTLPQACLDCDMLRACWGGCPKHRFGDSVFGDKGQYYLCRGNKKYYRHISKYLHGMAQLIENDLPVSMIMQAIDGPLVVDKSNCN